MSDDTIIKSEAYRGYMVEVHYDDDAPNPIREFDLLAKFVCWHRRYNLGNVDDFKTPDDFYTYADETSLVILPLYLFDHSGLTISTTCWQFRQCDPVGWDWGAVGYVYAEADAVKQERGWQRLSPKRRAYVESLLRQDVALYDAYLTGAVYGYIIKDSNGEEVDSCWGFYGCDHEESGLLPEARAYVDYHANQAIEIGAATRQ